MTNWHTYFMSLAEKVAERSKDPNTKVGAVIVDEHNRVLSTGYNGYPASVTECDWNEGKHKFVIHAEVNCILYAKQDLSNKILYTTLFPCLNCSKTLVAAGIKEVVYKDDTKLGQQDNIESKEFLKHCNINVRKVSDV